MNESGLNDILAATSHRPWPLPEMSWTMAQTWRDLLFAHWPVPPERLRPLVPRELALDTFDGQAWVAQTPFYLTNLHPRGLPALPVVSHFPEMNVRTYVIREGKPGVFFFSLDVANLSAVWGARIFYRLPYFHAAMKIAGSADSGLHYRSRRIHGPRPAEFRGRYRPISPPAHSKMGTLEHFLTERYCLYTVDRGRVYRGQIHHLPWPLQAAEAEIEHNSVPQAQRIMLPETPPLLHFAREMKVVVWPPERLA